MQELCTILEALYHSIYFGSNVYSSLFVCKERGCYMMTYLYLCTAPVRFPPSSFTAEATS